MSPHQAEKRREFLRFFNGQTLFRYLCKCGFFVSNEIGDALLKFNHKPVQSDLPVLDGHGSLF